MSTFPTFRMKRGDTLPRLRARLLNADDSPMQLGGVDGVVLRLRPVTGGALKVEAAAQVLDGDAGLVEYSWLAGDTDTAGAFDGEWGVTYPGAEVATVPGNGYFLLRILDRLG